MITHKSVLEVENLKLELPKIGKRGQLAGAMLAIVAILSVSFIALIYLFIGTTLTTSLGDNNTTTVWDNVQLMMLNFTTQLGNVGTILGVMLLLLVVGGGAYGGYQLYQKAHGGGTSGM